MKSGMAITVGMTIMGLILCGCENNEDEKDSSSNPVGIGTTMNAPGIFNPSGVNGSSSTHGSLTVTDSGPGYNFTMTSQTNQSSTVSETKDAP